MNPVSWWRRRRSRREARRQIQWGLDYIRDHYGPGATPPAWPGNEA